MNQTVSRQLSGLAILAAGVAVTVLLTPDPLADVFFAGIVLSSVLFTVVSGIGTWTNRTPLVWVAALLLTGLTILGLLSIGTNLVPAALLLLGAAVFSLLAGPRTDVRESIIADPPTTQEAMLRTLVGTAAVLGGGGLIYFGAFAQELFGPCANETLTCALEATNWGAVTLTVLGLFAVGFGGWLVWTQPFISRVLASTRAPKRSAGDESPCHGVTFNTIVIEHERAFRNDDVVGRGGMSAGTPSAG